MDSMANTNKICNFCGEEISGEARRCPYCGSLVNIKIEEVNVDYSTNVQDCTHIENENDAAFSTDDLNPLHDESDNEDTAYEADQNDVMDIEACEVEECSQPVKENIFPSASKSSSYETSKPLSNGMKVFLTIISTVIPGVGQLIGVIVAIIFMNSHEDKDRRSFGVALLVASLVFFVLSGFLFIVSLLTLFTVQI